MGAVGAAGAPSEQRAAKERERERAAERERAERERDERKERHEHTTPSRETVLYNKNVSILYLAIFWSRLSH